MASWRTTPATTTAQENNGPRAKCDQVVFEAIAKAAEIVVGSRCWIDGPSNFNNHYNSPNHGNINGHNNSNSSRFNLLVPEVQGVRSILQRWKRALHVPLRLDVYYQHKDSRRELLERWCLEYAPKPNNGNNNAGLKFFDDPIVQLRQVCKQIVVWLRTLYCWSRMLPAQALRQRHNNPIGFSIYVVSEGNDDVSGLVQNQGFQSQGQPHSVKTPYGELGWKVFYAPKNPMIQRLLPEKSPYSGTINNNGRPTKSQPIPMTQQQQQQQQHSPHQSPSSHKHLLQRRESASPTTTPHSAPHANGRMYRRANSATPAMISDGTNHSTSVGMATSLRPLRSNSGLPSFIHQQQQQQQQQQQSVPQGHGGTIPLSTSADSKPPTKSMSGLSLAMMQSDENIDDDNSKDPKEESTAEKRRAALHHPPPQFGSPVASSPVLKKSLASAGEYGYAYNNHIPIPNSNRGGPPFVSATDDPIQQSPRSSTPTTPLASTPPGYLYGGPTPPAVVPSNLIPPRNAVTPPFVRPMGFVGEPPSQPLPPAPSGAAAANQYHHAMIPNLKASHHTSLDLLHSSPFQHLPHHPGSALFGGINASSVLPPTAGMNSLADMHHHHDSNIPGQLFDYSNHHHYDISNNHSFDPNHDNHNPNNDDDNDEDDMPFAVDTATPEKINASMIAVPAKKKLALFEKTNASQMTTTSVTSLADQLAEFKSFGASLNLGTMHGDDAAAATGSGPTASTNAGSTSSNTPIYLRT